MTLQITASVDEGTVGNTITNEDNNRDEAIITVGEAPTGGGGGAHDDSCAGKVIISAVARSGTAANPDHKWIELRNIGGEPVDLTGWVIRWRKKEPVAPKGFEWKTVDLSGVLERALVFACELAEGETAPPVEFVRRDEDSVSWLVVARPVDIDDSYLTIERETDDTISALGADIVYDTVEPYHMELSNAGDVIELIDENGTIVDTANAFDSPQAAWPAGEASGFATMERTDPPGPDTPENWHTNLGVVIWGLDANGKPLVATADTVNSPTLEEVEILADLEQRSYALGSNSRLPWS